jgi:hypothetical protein
MRRVDYTACDGNSEFVIGIKGQVPEFEVRDLLLDSRDRDILPGNGL